MENTNLKSLLKTGTFGQIDEGLFFVVVGDRLVYEGGGFDEITDFNDELICVDDFDGEIFNSVKFIFSDICTCFDCARCIIKFNEQVNIIWSREDYEKEKEMDNQHSDYVSNKTVAKFVEDNLAEEKTKKQVPTPTLGEVVSLVDSMRKIMIERQNPATDEAIAKMAKTIYKQFGYELPEIEGE